ncbi:MAG: hypothetical protein WCZ86_06300 [Desulfurivibrionaceae bacterium]
MTFTEFKQVVMGEFLSSYPDQEPAGSPIGSAQADAIWDRLQSLVLTGRLIYDRATEVTLVTSTSSVNLAAEDPPIGEVESARNGTSPLRQADGAFLMQLDSDTDGLIEFWTQPNQGTLLFWRSPSTDTDITLECFIGLPVAVKTTGEIPLPEDTLLLLASCICHRMARRADPNMKAMAERGYGIAKARALTNRLRVRLK